MSIIVLSDAFAGTTIDTGKWTETDPNGRISQNGAIILTNPHTGDELFFTNKLISVASITSGVAVVQANMTWSDDSNNEAEANLFLYVDANNYARIGSRSTAGGKYLLVVVQGGSARYVYDNAAAPTKGKDVKITYNLTSKEIKYWWWNTDTWTQIGATATWDLGSTVYMLMATQDVAGYTAVDTATFDNAYLFSTDSTTQYPVADVAYTLSLSDTFNMTDSFTRQVDFIRAVADTFAITDTNGKGLATSRTDIMTFSDSLATVKGWGHLAEVDSDWVETTNGALTWTKTTSTGTWIKTTTTGNWTKVS